MTKITEQQLLEAVARLNRKTGVQEDAASMGQTLGNAAGIAAGGMAAIPRAGIAAGQAVADKAGGWWDAAKQGVSNAANAVSQGVQNFAGGVAQGAKQGWAATDPSKLMGGGQSAKPTKYPTTPAEIKAFQQANGLTADGIAGPKTQAALAKLGLKPAAPAGGQSAKPAAKPAAAPQTQTQQNFAAAGMAGQEMRSPEEIAASQDLLTANDGSTTQGAAPAARNPNAGLTPDDPRWQGPKPAAAAAPAPAAPAPTATAESTTFKNDELNRLVSLVQYR